jgi:UDP-3-O-[3-hydroxymyristoyl] N-acetylglucosamine deacetylase/3-hydroxyacyl-[acyl-carrier-protein] dehydratase
VEPQRTIKNEASLSGVGLHTGNKVEIKLKPSPADSGINFVRIDLPGNPALRAHLSTALDLSRSPRRTSVGRDAIEVHTIEHLMAALWACGIDNILIEINNNEIPGMDGSAAEFFEILKTAGIQTQDCPKKVFSVKEPLLVEEGDSFIAAFPSGSLKISYTLDYDRPFLKPQYLSLFLNDNVFEKELAPARTFCLEEEAEELRRQGLGKGANYENTIVLGDNGVIKNTLRFEDEFARHKILDLIGDLYLLGFSLRAHIIAVKSGHPLNMMLLKKIQAQKERYELGGVWNLGCSPSQTHLDTKQIMEILPHRYPFLFIDRILHLEPGRRAVGIKNVSANDYFFTGHFPGRPVMPGVLIVEAMAQVGGVLMLSQETSRGKIAYFMSINNVKFRKTVVPGDQLILEVEVVKLRSKTGQVHGRALVENKVVAEADLMFSLVEA